MDISIPRVPPPHNEPVLGYLPGSTETKALKDQISVFLATEIDVPVIINGKERRTGKTDSIVVPHDHKHRLGTFHQATAQDVRDAIDGPLVAFNEWSRFPAEDRAAVFLKAAELLSTKYRPVLNAATMLGQSKTCHQSEVDAACELIDFWRFNVSFQEQLYQMQPVPTPGLWNRLEYRPLEGFVFAVTPFNFTAIAGNLPTSAALLGNVVLWKPASTAVYSGYFIMKLLEEAGLPPGVIQFLPGSGSAIGEVAMADSNLAGIHFTGSTGVFQQMWKSVGEKIASYRNYPRIVGETGGKDFIIAHASADPAVLSTAIVRGAFEYQGQKCSAASRAYIPKSLWGQLRDRVVGDVSQIAMGDVRDFRNFMAAVIDKKSFANIRGYIEEARKSPDAKILIGGGCKDDVGYFVEPTVIEVTNPRYRTMCEEIFGPVITVYAYDDNRFEDTLKLCDETSPYALTGAIHARDRKAIRAATLALTHSAGNFYINTKPSGAVVGQQPFGGARASGTNDKAGSLFNLSRWVSVRTVSETFVPPTNFRYPLMG